jgi:hypothetical protein
MAKAKSQGSKATKAGKAVKRVKDGRFMGVRIADPVVKPRNTTVGEIRKAVDSVMSKRKRA